MEGLNSTSLPNTKMFKLKGVRLNIIYRNLQSSSFSPRRIEGEKNLEPLDKNYYK